MYVAVALHLIFKTLEERPIGPYVKVTIIYPTHSAMCTASVLNVAVNTLICV